MIVAGIDFSMSSPGITIGEKGSTDLSFHAFRQKKKQVSSNANVILYDHNKDYKLDVERFDNLASWVTGLLIKYKVEEVFMEGYAYGASGNTFSIGEATGILKHKLWMCDLNLQILQPGAVKKFATGKGNAGKDLMYKEFKTEPLDFCLADAINETVLTEKVPAPISDLVDSYWIWKLGCTLV